MKPILSDQHFYVHPQHVYVNTSTYARMQTYEQTHTQTGLYITAMKKEGKMQQARFMLRQDWTQGPTRVCLKNC